MNKEKIIISSKFKPISVAEHKNYMEATFIISVLDEWNLNNVLIRKAEGEKYYKTIVGYPIQAFLKYDEDDKPSDFGGHELRAYFNPETHEIEYYFATQSIGTVIDAWIEEREVDGYEGKRFVIMIKAKLWHTRYPQYALVFNKLWEQGKISSSWEIDVEEYEQVSEGKILKIFEFIGNCLLGSDVTGAVVGAGVIDVASKNKINNQLSYAFAQDIKNQGGNHEMDKNKSKINTNTASLTDNDLYTKLRHAINATDDTKYYYIARIYPYDFKVIAYESWDRENEDDYVEFTYTVSEDSVIITGQADKKMVFVDKSTYDSLTAQKDDVKSLQKDIATKNDDIIKLGQDLQAEKDKVKELEPFKAQIEKAEEEKKEKELAEKKEQLKELATKGGYITKEEIETSEEIKKMIDEVNENGIKAIMAERMIEAIDKDKNENTKPETSEVNVPNVNIKANINNDDEIVMSITDLMKKYYIND